ncbi:MAG: FAD-dependent oxidoreductase, partial [Paraburkholderia tropica]
MNDRAQLFEAGMPADAIDARPAARQPVALGVEEALARTRLFPFWLDNPAEPPAEPKLTSDTRAD